MDDMIFSFKVETPPAWIPIGRTAENDWRTIEIDCSYWFNMDATGNVVLMYRPSCNMSPYPLLTERDGDSIIWRPKSGELVEGVGRLQAFFEVGTDVIGSSDMISCEVDSSLLGAEPGTDPGQTDLPWALDIIEQIAELSGHYPKIIDGDLFVWDSEIEDWVQFEGGSSDAVLYTQQILTPAQQAQARGNIGAGTYSKPSGGIPASDLASGVIPSVPQMATQADMSDWTSGKTVDAATLKTDYQYTLNALVEVGEDVESLRLSKASKSELPDASTSAPVMDGTAAVGTSTDYARADHVHPSDTTRLSTTGNAYRSASIPMGHLDATSTATVMTATVDGITELRDGVCMWLRNGVITSASGFTLNVNNLGAKPCYSSLAAESRSTTIFNVNYTMLFVYNSTRVDGGCWDIVYGVDTNTTYTPVKLGFGYGTCTTAAATVAKTASISSYALTAGGIVSIKFDNDVPSGATLNISSKGAKAIYYRGAAITADVIKGGDTATFVYSTYYHLIAIDRDDVGDALPAVTASDNGKVLAVNNGEWSADSPVIVSGTDAQVANAVNDYLTQYGVPLRLSEEIKQALLDCFENVAWINDQGQTYYDALYAALYPPVDVLSISAVFTQGSAVIYDTDDLDTLKQYLVVTATMTDSTTQTVTGYTLSGTLTEGTSTITVSYGGKTTTFNVTVSEQQHLTGYTTVGNPTIDGQNRMTTSDGNFIKTPFNFDNGGLPWELRAKVNVSETNQPFVSNVGFYDIINCVNSQNASTRGILVEFNHSGGDFDYKLNLFASDTANSWNIVSPKQESISIQSLFNGDVYIKAGWTGSAYYIAASADGVTWSNELRHEWTGKTTSIMTGYPIAFGNKRNKAWGYCIYVDSLELDIDGALYWKAVG